MSPSHPVAPDDLLDRTLEQLTVAPERAAVLLDVDGTLAPIVRHADDAHVAEPMRAPLIRIARRYGFVACVSGRQASVARRIVSLGSITYVGNHGGEVLPGGATRVEVDAEIATWTRSVKAFARSAYDDELRRLRVREEDKDAIAAFHWRGTPDEAAAERAMQDVARRAEEEGLAVHWGRKVLEVRAPVKSSKGTAVARLLDRADVDVALYAGDDMTDIDAFDELRAAVADGRLRAAVCLGVASEETPDELAAAADLLVDGTAGVRRVLERLAEA